MSKAILDLAKERTVLLDGGMGTELFRYGLPQGACPELWNKEKPEVVGKIHKSYFDAGSDCVLTNSFGGNRIKLAGNGLEKRCFELNQAAAQIAVGVKPEGRFVGGSMGPTGKFLKPQGEGDPEEFEKAFAEQARGLEAGGVDFLLLETFFEPNEVLCALRGARSAVRIPVFVTMTFNRGPRGFFTLMGNGAAECMEMLEKEGVPAVGANCTLDSADMSDLVKVMRESTALPLIAQANAGQPSLADDDRVVYGKGLEDFLSSIPRIIENGANIVGGCCGTNPDYIRRMAELIKGS